MIKIWQPQFNWIVNFLNGNTFGRYPGYKPNYIRPEEIEINFFYLEIFKNFKNCYQNTCD